jgi:cystathionine beta-synthase
MKVHDHILQVVGDTPLVRLHTVTKGIKATVYVKCEHLNPGGSIKDRIALHMINKAEESGKLKPGGTIVEPSSGNTGAGLAMIGCLRGYRVIVTMPDKMSRSKTDYLRAFGAEVIVCPTSVEPEDPRSYYSVAKKLLQDIPNSYSPDQYSNQYNPEAHYLTTAPEIWNDLDGKIHTFVAGMGTGGTISGISKYLKEKDPKIRTVGVDPVGSLYHDYMKTGKLGVAESYKIEGVGEDMIPEAIDFDLIDESVQVSDQEAFIMARQLAKDEALFVGGSAGMAVYGALKVARKLNHGDVVICILPDHGDRYLATYFNDNWMHDNQFLVEPKAMRAQDVLDRKVNSRLITVAPGTSISEVSKLFKAGDFSQIPVMEDEKVLGTLYEDRILEHLLQGGDTTKASEIMEEPLPTIGPNLGVEGVLDNFKSGAPAVLVQGDSLEILTKFDLMTCLAQQ